MCGCGLSTHPEHVLALAVENASARLQVLATQEFGKSQRDGVGWPRNDGPGLTRRGVVVVRMRVRVSMLVGVLVIMLMAAALLGLLLLCLQPFLRLPLEVFCNLVVRRDVGQARTPASDDAQCSPMYCGTVMPLFSASIASCRCMAAICSGLGIMGGIWPGWGPGGPWGPCGGGGACIAPDVACGKSMRSVTDGRRRLGASGWLNLRRSVARVN